MPFTGQHSLQIRTQIIKLCSGTFPHIKLRFVFRPSLRLAHFFPFKGRVPKSLKSCVVYSFKCQRCSSLYIGQTCRLLHTRISDHLGISAITGKKRVNPAPTSILLHERDTGHPVSPHDLNVLSSSTSSLELLIRETLLIRKFNPSLNANLGSFPLSILDYAYFVCFLTVSCLLFVISQWQSVTSLLLSLLHTSSHTPVMLTSPL